MESKPKPHYLGHRSRLRKRLLDSKQGQLPDYEILELILCLSYPRTDVKPLAKKLIEEFGSFAKVINLSPEILSKVKGVAESVISSFRIIQEAASRLIKEEISSKPIIESWKALLDYCRATMGHINTEQFRVLYLDRKNMVIADELQEFGTVNQVAIYPREIMKKALHHEASSIILVHNHPSGNTKPSRADIEMTKQISQIGILMGIDIHDHIIVSSKNYFSFKSNGLL
jgi:DNA repair protein RadC